MAKRFKFRLEGLHNYRIHKTTEAKNALGEISRTIRIKEAEVTKRVEYLDVLSHNAKRSKAGDTQMWLAHRDTIKEEISSLKKEIINLQEIESLRRNELTYTMRDEKVLEKLRDQRQQEHHQEELRQEQSLMDEIALRTGTGQHEGRNGLMS